MMPQQVVPSPPPPAFNLDRESNGESAPDKPSESGEQNSETQVSGVNNGNANTNSGSTNGAASNQKSATKLNGLKNRILQRPPPLILDKVSNFYADTTTQADNVSSSQQQPCRSEKNPIGTQNNGANHKFWASLNQNASRTRGLAPNGASSADQAEELSRPADSSLGADLIITHRNNGTPATSRTSTQKPTQQKQQSGKTLPNELKAAPIAEEQPKSRGNSDTDTKQHDMSNNSELDDSSTHGGGNSENDHGGNLIGVDHPSPPPASTGSVLGVHLPKNEEPPLSAASSRPRSNNPFLAMDEEAELMSSLGGRPLGFHKRPASFIAATDGLMKSQQHQQVFGNDNGIIEAEEQLGNMRIVDQQQQQRHHLISVQQQQQQQQDSNSYCSKLRADLPLLSRHHQQLQQVDLRDGSIYSSSIGQQQGEQIQADIYGVYCQAGASKYINYDQPTISLDSESAVCNPPPSATMQSPHWTDAIYELNNAILESSSVAGGAENGEFIYIVESGDIIIELDRVKVSGFTLSEFNELLDSKPVHLLNAVQTKHSHGLTNNLKYYLNCSFPKNSTDKELQDLIRENIYRRTIPCTTRLPKEGELDKVDYHFLSKEQFIEINNRGMLLECGMFGGHYYGTLRPFSDLSSLSIYGSLNQNEISDDMRQPLNVNHPALGLVGRKDAPLTTVPMSSEPVNPIYENHESLRKQQIQITDTIDHTHPVRDLSGAVLPPMDQRAALPLLESGLPLAGEKPSIVAVDNEALPHGWERVIDQTHGTYYIDHNTQRTQYERPYEIELTKGSMGFGFTLVEAENGVLLVRSVIPGGPAHLNGTIRPGDILISAVGVSVAGLQHTDVARLFSTFAVGDRVRLTFARSAYVVDANLVPDEYLFSNGTYGDMAVAVNSNSNYYHYFNQNMLAQNPHIFVDQEFEHLKVTLKRGDQGFGFTISDSIAGQKVRKIQNNETCTNLKQGDILVNLNGQDITKLTHKEVVERLKNCPAGKDVTLTVKRKKRFRSKTPLAMHTENDEYSLDSTPQRNCKTPSLDGLMLRRSTINTNTNEFVARNLFAKASQPEHTGIHPNHMSLPPATNQTSIDYSINYCTVQPPAAPMEAQSIYGLNPSDLNNDLYCNQHLSLPTASQLNTMDLNRVAFRRSPASTDGNVGLDNMTSLVNPSEAPLPPVKFANANGLSQLNQYNNFMNNDKLVMMQMQQRYQQMVQQAPSVQPVYSNSDMLKAEQPPLFPKPPAANYQQLTESYYGNNYQNNYYANNEEIAVQRMQYARSGASEGTLPAFDQSSNRSSFISQHQHQQPQPQSQPLNSFSFHQTRHQDEPDEYEYHQVDLDRGNTDSNWGIRLIGGSEVDRAISIGSIVKGGAASKNGKLKPCDEIISINAINVVGATHQHVVELISACTNRASLVIRRKKFVEACEVALTRNMDEGFGFVIISSGNCALIGRIIEGSPADRCRQLHVRDRIIAVNGRCITANMQHPEIVNMIKESGSTLRLRIIPADCYTVELIKNSLKDNFGFSMRGGSEYDGTPLYILRVAANGLARDLLNVGDQIIEINGIPTVGMTHHQAATIIKYSDPTVKLKLRRNYVTPPSLLVDSPRALQKFNQVTAEMRPVNVSSTPSYAQEAGSVSPELGSLSHQHSSLAEQPISNSNNNNNNNNNNAAYYQSMPLYAS